MLSSKEKQLVVADESPKTEKKAPAKPRAKKAVAVAESATEGGETQQQPAAESSPKTAKKAAAKPSAAKKATNVVDNAESVSAEKKATKPRAKKVAEPVATPAAVAEIELVTEETEFVEVEVEVEVSEFEFGGVQYLRAKDNKLYDPETSEIVGVWNEETSAIDKCNEEIEVEQAD